MKANHYEKIRCNAGEHAPCKVERVWCERLEDGTYRVDNIPFFSDEIHLHDRFRAVLKHDGLWVGSIVERSGNHTIRVFLSEGHDSDRDATTVGEEIKALGLTFEGALPVPMLVVSVHPGADVKKLVSWLKEKKDAGLIEKESGYEE